MNADQWRAAGYLVRFEDGRHGHQLPVVILTNQVGEQRYMSVRGGAWMAFSWEDFLPYSGTPS